MQQKAKNLIHKINDLFSISEFIIKQITSKKGKNNGTTRIIEEFTELKKTKDHFSEIFKKLGEASVIHCRSDHTEIKLLAQIKRILITYNLSIEDVGITENDNPKLKNILLN